MSHTYAKVHHLRAWECGIIFVWLAEDHIAGFDVEIYDRLPAFRLVLLAELIVVKSEVGAPYTCGYGPHLEIEDGHGEAAEDDPEVEFGNEAALSVRTLLSALQELEWAINETRRRM